MTDEFKLKVIEVIRWIFGTAIFSWIYLVLGASVMESIGCALLTGTAIDFLKQ